MRKTISKDYGIKQVALVCDCFCSTLVFNRIEWEDDGFIYEITFEDDLLYGRENGLAGRVKRAFKILFGKPVYRASVTCEPKELTEFINSVKEITKNDKEFKK